MLSLIFCLAIPHPHQNLLKQLPPPVNIEAIEQNRCAEMQRLLGGSSLQLFARQAPNAWLAMFQQVFSTQLSPKNSENTFFPICTTFHLPVYGVF
jgi:hypothetical protein